MKFLDKEENVRKPLPRYLYKYYSNLEYAIDAIRNHRIHIEMPSGYNDVFDSARVVDESELDFVLCNNNCDMFVAKTERNYKELVFSLLNNCSCELTCIEDTCEYLLQGGVPCGVVKNIKLRICNDLKNAQPNNNKITCFTHKNDSLLMWAHYGNHLKGVCLCFDTKKEPLLFNHAFRVEYSRIRNRERNYNFYYHKALEWKYEKEWRIVVQGQEDYISTNSCVGVIIGERAAHENDLQFERQESPYSNFLKISFLAHGEGLKVYKAIANDAQYKIDIVRKSS